MPPANRQFSMTHAHAADRWFAQRTQLPPPLIECWQFDQGWSTSDSAEKRMFGLESPRGGRRHRSGARCALDIAVKF
nr:hypothetical protein [Kibdelosporangium sp. MJ126-NF4]CTQ90866.1 hypothetical protein [Kibdelosporangium sp. MJ126-NF4]